MLDLVSKLLINVIFSKIIGLVCLFVYHKEPWGKARHTILT